MSKNKRMPKWLKAVLFTFLGIFVVFEVLTELPICTLPQGKTGDHSRFLRDCVSQNDSLRNKPMTEISLLGSHDSFANGINMFSAPNVNEDNIVNNDALRFFGKGFIVREAKAQYHGPYDQLMGGVRYFDVRVTCIDGVYYNSHGLLSGRFDANLIETLKFLYENPGEFIVFSINNYYPGESSWEGLAEFIEGVKYEGKSLYDYIHYDETISEYSDLTYDDLTVNGTEAGVLFYADYDNKPGRFSQFNRSHYDSKWHNMVSHDAITEKIREHAQVGKDLGSQYLRINQAQQTGNFDEPVGMVLGWSLLAMAKYHNAKMVQLPDIAEILDGLPIYMCDFSTCTYGGFNDSINCLLAARNTTL